MIAGNFAALNDCLGFEVKADGEVPQSTVKAKVLRIKAAGDWRLWFTGQDVDLFKPAYKNYSHIAQYPPDQCGPGSCHSHNEYRFFINLFCVFCRHLLAPTILNYFCSNA